MRLPLGRESVGHTPTGVVLMLSLFFVGPTRIPAQGADYPKSPMDVLKAYRKMDSEGERLTPEGWYRASKFFIKPERPPQKIVMYVTDGERITGPNPWIEGDKKTEIELVCSAEGQIDSSGLFTSLLSPGLAYPPRPRGSQSHGPAPTVRPYDLVLTDTHWEFGPNLEDPREVKGSLEWRIEAFEIEPWVTIETAIRYLTRLRDGSSSETIKKNADKSIATLRRVH
ncbi:MAG: hypothetical protein ACLQPN_08640 [Bryobacteraceae bacterium]